MLFNNLPIYELVISDEADGVSMISLVEKPAVKIPFLKFETNELQCFSIADNELHIVTGVAMLANTPIYRSDETGNYYIMFTPETIREMMEKFAKDKSAFNINLNHETPVNDCFVVESYLIDKQRGIVPAEFIDVPDGSWVISVKIENDDIWNEILTTNHLNGFSIECKMNTKAIVSMSENEKHEPKLTLEERILKGKF